MVSVQVSCPVSQGEMQEPLQGLLATALIKENYHQNRALILPSSLNNLFYISEGYYPGSP